MHDRDPEHWQHTQDDHWASFADAMDLTIEGHRLIAQEIVFEMRVLWRGVARRMRALIGSPARRGSSPRV